VLIAVHGVRSDAIAVARTVSDELLAAGIEVRAQTDVDVVLPGVDVVRMEGAAEGCELVVVVGGDGTMLRGAELARPYDVPILGVNLGHVGFLAEAEREQASTVVRAVVDRTWTVENRTTLEVVVTSDGEEVARSWALNEASVEKASRERMLEVLVEIDGRPLSTFGADGVVMATPTGSTAYAFSAGGPVVWPEVEALLVVPISAHALFARPLVVAPTSTLVVQLLAQHAQGVLWCDGRRLVELPAGSRVEVTRHPIPVRFARLHRAPFTDRLVAKFALPVDGWRGRRPGAQGPS
jgi:NAD+ kinase